MSIKDIHYFCGDLSGLMFPADIDGLVASGTEFLTKAFRASGILDERGCVSAVDRLAAFEGGSTGQKAELTVSYNSVSKPLSKHLFVKFSRDFNDSKRDSTRVQMASEVYMARLSAMPGFPLMIPRCFFADYHAESGSGILITERVPFGEADIEPLKPKSVDHMYLDVVAYYRCVLADLGTLAGTHAAGKLSTMVEQWFPFNPKTLLVDTRPAPTTADLAVKIDQFESFIEAYPQLLPSSIASPALILTLREGAPMIVAAEAAIFDVLGADPAYIALCHWNAQLDNAWFWRSDKNDLRCGLMDWGNAGQLNVAMAIWGCLCGAQIQVWEQIDDLVAVFIEAFYRAGGRMLRREQVMAHLDLYIAHMGVRYMLDTPSYIQSRLPAGSRPNGYLDPIIQDDERLRSQLAILTNFLGRWVRRDYSAMIRAFITE